MGIMLLEQGRLHLFDPVAKFIPGFDHPKILGADGKLTPAAGPITVEHLFTHRSGLSYGFMPDCPVGALYREHNLGEDDSRSLTDYVDILPNLPIAFEPGTRWHYSCSTDVLARIIESVIGLYKIELIRQRGPWRHLKAVELATLEWVDWFNHHRSRKFNG
jgi:CubicO group peptidase (beta-lactamase class C family)